jgi:hypothetical protein
MKTITKRQMADTSNVWAILPEYEYDDPISPVVLVGVISDKEFIDLCCKTVLTLEKPKAKFLQKVAPHTQQTNAWAASQEALQKVVDAELARQRNIILEICE